MSRHFFGTLLRLLLRKLNHARFFHDNLRSVGGQSFVYGYRRSMPAAVLLNVTGAAILEWSHEPIRTSEASRPGKAPSGAAPLMRCCVLFNWMHRHGNLTLSFSYIDATTLPRP